ncbi:Sugar phosphate isomerase/epimerase [Chitinophaga costaii]|uniref:Sugar phosphate isomerase/epimerase n=1 Tax=Chitinophaga costaii TaxID=1335309 RepID=A0A1C4EEW3_9BACT|nr:sugar phosphate isomerase/epimerase [Chitinophaga costaii]PUZ23871.1 sugar phosphate isomerase/epimerase [Chitinophaga costaii]SCC42071.1 Sugar phosphate isomerase/epimerase [Chitinophaga costaii]
MYTRRNFLFQSVIGLAATSLAPLLTVANTRHSKSAAGKTTSLPVGIAGYTFAKLDLDQSLAIMKRVAINYLSIKDIHLPINSSPEKIKEVLDKISAAGVKVYAVGVIYMKTKEAVDEAFEYAKRVGVPLIVGVPTPELIDYAEEKVKAYNIRLAIHNHGPEDKLYPAPRIVYDLIKNRDSRLGLCMDIGHATRAGENPAQAALAYHTRLFDLHIKDVTAAQQDGKAVEIGRGVIDFAALALALDKIKYAGICSIEFEKDMQDPLAGIAESAGYFRGVVHTVEK